MQNFKNHKAPQYNPAIACEVLSEYGKIINLEKVLFFNAESKTVRWQSSWMDFTNELRKNNNAN